MPVLLLALLVLTPACADRTRTLWREQTLPTGKTIKVTAFNLAWGVEHDERNAANDTFALEYVSAAPGMDVPQREAEAVAAFELIRPLCEQWGFRTAQIAAFPTQERKGRYDQYRFERTASGAWSFTRSEAKVLATDH